MPFTTPGLFSWSDVLNRERLATKLNELVSNMLFFYSVIEPTYVSGDANEFWGTPDGAPGAASLRPLVKGDIQDALNDEPDAHFATAIIDSPKFPTGAVVGAVPVITNVDGSMSNTLGIAIPAGAIFPYAAASAPAGYSLCDGSALVRDDHPLLFAAIGTTYGVGNGTTTFNIPDLRGRMLLPLDNLGGSSANRVTASSADSLGGTGGEETHTLVTAELASHSHVQRGRNNSTDGNAAPRGQNLSTNTDLSSTGTEGSGTAHNNMPPYMALSFIIKTG